MANTYTPVTQQDGDWWIGWIEEAPGVNCQERTRGELLDSLRTTLGEALQFNASGSVAPRREGGPDDAATARAVGAARG